MISTIALLTDFGLEDTYVGVMKAVIAGIAESVQIIDLTHAIPAGDLRCAALELWRAAPYLPPGAVILAVVDPGVGSERPAVAVEFKNHIAVGPDNGIFSYLLFDEVPARTIRLENVAFQRLPRSSTFHGRDVFAPAAAHLAAGVKIEALGSPASGLKQLTPPRLELPPGNPIEGEILHRDRFGNLITSIGKMVRDNQGAALYNWIRPREQPIQLRDPIRLELPGGITLAMRDTFADVPSGQPLAYTGSSGLLEIGLRDGDAADSLQLHIGDSIRLTSA